MVGLKLIQVSERGLMSVSRCQAILFTSANMLQLDRQSGWLKKQVLGQCSISYLEAHLEFCLKVTMYSKWLGRQVTWRNPKFLISDFSVICSWITLNKQIQYLKKIKNKIKV